MLSRSALRCRGAPVPLKAKLNAVLSVQCRHGVKMVSRKEEGSQDKAEVGRKLMKLSVDADLEQKLGVFSNITSLRHESFISSKKIADQISEAMRPDIEGKPFFHVNGGPGVLAISAIKTGAEHACVFDRTVVYYPLMLNYLRFYGNFAVHKIKYDSLLRVSSDTMDRAETSMKISNTRLPAQLKWEDEDWPCVIMTALDHRHGAKNGTHLKCYDLRLGLFRFGRPVLYTCFPSFSKRYSTWYSLPLRGIHVELACRYDVQVVDTTLPLSLTVTTGAILEHFQPHAISSILVRCRPKIRPDLPPGIATQFLATTSRIVNRLGMIGFNIHDVMLNLTGDWKCTEDIIAYSGLGAHLSLQEFSPNDWLRLALAVEEISVETFDTMCGESHKSASTALDLNGILP